MKKLFTLLFLQFYCVYSYAGLQLEATRVIYSSANSSAALTLKNNTDKNYMLQTWLETADKKIDKSIPIQVVPPIMKIDARKEGTLRFIYSGQGLAADRETLFWINTQEIPPAADRPNVLQIAVHSRLKLFYRPQAVNGKLSDEVKNLEWKRNGNTLTAVNNGPMYISLNKLHTTQSKNSNADVDIDMVSPYSSRDFKLPQSVAHNSTISFSYVNDYGGISEVKDAPIK